MWPLNSLFRPPRIDLCTNACLAYPFLMDWICMSIGNLYVMYFMRWFWATSYEKMVERKRERERENHKKAGAGIGKEELAG